MTLDAFDRQTSLRDPIHGTNAFTTTYRADGQASAMAAPNGNSTALTYDALGRALTKVTTAAGPVTRASYTWTRNKAGQILSEASIVTGDPTNGTTTYTYDPIERLIGFTRAAVTTAYGWQAEPNRASVQVGANPAVTTSFDDADRPTSDSGGGTYTSDLDGRLTLLSGKTLVWDSLGRLTQVKTGATPIATYSYDPLDRLRLADYGAGVRTRLRYVGLTTAVAQLVDDAAGTVTRHMGTDWSGQRLVDWTGTGQNQRFTGTNGHHDVTWTASDTGAVTATLRYDPWGTLTSSTGSSSNWPDLRFQSSWYDPTTNLSWVVSRWYAPSLGRFVSEDSLLGEPADPPSRHLYAYGAGEPVDRWDPDGGAAYRTYSIANRAHLKGWLTLSLFIMRPYNLVDLPGAQARLYGDNRSWGPSCTRSRACIQIDLDAKKVYTRVNNSCGDWNVLVSGWFGYGCTYAFPIRTTRLPYTCLRGTSGSCGYPQQYNLIRVTESAGGAITIVWDITQSRLPVIRPGLTVNGKMVIRPGRCCAIAPTIEYSGEGFPSEELYWYNTHSRNFVRRTVFQHREGGWQDMSWARDWQKTYILPQR